MKLIELTDENMIVKNGTAYYVAGDEKPKPKPQQKRRPPAKKKAKSVNLNKWHDRVRAGAAIAIIIGFLSLWVYLGLNFGA